MDRLKKELERKRKAMEEAKKQTNNDGAPKKYRTTSEWRQLQEQHEAQRQRGKEQHYNESSRVYKMSATDSETLTPVTQADGHPKAALSLQAEASLRRSAAASARTGDQDVSTLSFADMKARFRALHEPIRLFGETLAEQRARLSAALQTHQTNLANLAAQDEFKLQAGHETRNVFLEKEEEEHQQHHQSKKANKEAPDADDVNEDLSNDPHKKIYRYFKDLLNEWEDDLAARPDAAKRSVAGKTETKTVKQCKDYIRPLFKLCKQRTLEDAMVAHLTKIVDCCVAGEFVRAHDAYLDVAIGRSPWPIGVTQVGIHSRTGRSKIEANNVAHIMNSEESRKYLTSVKRLMTFAQKKREDVAHSKKVM